MLPDYDKSIYTEFLKENKAKDERLKPDYEKLLNSSNLSTTTIILHTESIPLRKDGFRLWKAR